MFELGKKDQPVQSFVLQLEHHAKSRVGIG